MIERDDVLKYLQDKQETEGGYTGNDLTVFAEQLGVTTRGLRKRISNWINNDKEFKPLIYLGKATPSITLSKSTYYRIVDQTLLSQYSYEKEYQWFESQKITIPVDYSLEKNRDSLSTLFIFSDLKTYGGADLTVICERLTKSKDWFSIYDVKANRFY